MKIIYVSRSKTGVPHPFVKEQADVVSKNFKVNIQHFLISRGGIQGYSKAVLELLNTINKNGADIIHVHYGLSALVVVLNKLLFFKNYKIIITFHGSDINKQSERRLSLLAAQFSSHNILVSEKMAPFFRKDYSVIPCGIDTDVNLSYRQTTRGEKGWGENDFVVLFSSNFSRDVKDPAFAFEVINAFSASTDRNVQFVELAGYSRLELTGLMQAADALLLCSKTEGSPQVVKEAILNALPVVANDVGDVGSICSGVDNCFIVPKKVEEFVRCLHLIASKNARVKNRHPIIQKFDNNIISNKLFSIYTNALKSDSR